MTAKISVSILGLGRLGTSFGLALKRCNERKDARQTFVITGYDTDPSRTAAAADRKAVDSIAKSAADAARDKDIVLIALPFGEVQGGFRAIAGSLRDGAVILDTTPYKAIAAGWAQKSLPPHAHLIGVTPVINVKYLFDGADTPDYAQADYFDDGMLIIVPDAKSQPEAIELAADFAILIGAKAHFADPSEHDSWMTWMETLPLALSLSAFMSMESSSAWEDARQISNGNFGRLTHHLYDTTAADLRDLMWENRAGLSRSIDAAIQKLDLLRSLLNETDAGALEEALERSAENYAKWLARRRDNTWTDMPDQRPRVPVGGTFAGVLLGNYLSKKLRREDKED
ncbi:prephenate dehydrogenase/arogenate dehydrogenase family protein [Anaerolineae bacterium CFX9]|nr:prephenate dehydrogenase/arogenate dehydrogenase family protein [Anaerolineae bacterium CFX9]